MPARAGATPGRKRLRSVFWQAGTTGIISGASFCRFRLVEVDDVASKLQRVALDARIELGINGVQNGTLDRLADDCTAVEPKFAVMHKNY
jgi:hypothetical protein